jgi:enoyl-CoA hydratase
MPDAPAEPDVQIEQRGRIGLITLNRPRAINALNHGMVDEIAAVLEQWRADESVHAVVLTGSGDRGFCAGGDVVAIYRDALAARQGQGGEALRFWRDEYVLDAAIARYPKPVVALMDGIVLGGGIGLAAHASQRIVTETSSLGLPETTIGFVPDVGGTYLLSRAPGQLGTHLALTADSMDGATAIALGFADRMIERADIPTLIDALIAAPTLSGGDVDAVIDRFAKEPPTSALLADRAWIDEAYSADTVGEILDRLGALGTPQAVSAAETILRKSPIAVCVTLESLRRAASLGSLEEVLDQEFRVSTRSLLWPDIVEGIRAQVVDKDRNPQWNPARLHDVDPAMINACFAPLGAAELGLAARAR